MTPCKANTEMMPTCYPENGQFSSKQMLFHRVRDCKEKDAFPRVLLVGEEGEWKLWCCSRADLRRGVTNETFPSSEETLRFVLLLCLEIFFPLCNATLYLESI